MSSVAPDMNRGNDIDNKTSNSGAGPDLPNGHTSPNGHSFLTKTMTIADDPSYYTHHTSLEGSGIHNNTTSSNGSKSLHHSSLRKQRRRMASLQRWIEAFPDPFILCDPFGAILASNQKAKDTFGGILHLRRPPHPNTSTFHHKGADSLQLNDLFDLLAPASSKHSLCTNGGVRLTQRSTSHALGTELTEPVEASCCSQQQQPRQPQGPLDDCYPTSLAQIQKELPLKRVVRRKTCHGDQRLYLESLAPLYGRTCCKDRCECPDSDEGALESSDEAHEHRHSINANNNTDTLPPSEPDSWLQNHYTATRTTGDEPIIGYSVTLTDLSQVLPGSMASSWSIFEHTSLPTPPGASDGGDRSSLGQDPSMANPSAVSTTPAAAALMSSHTLSSESRSNLESRPQNLRQHHHPPRVAPDKIATDTHSRNTTNRSEEASEVAASVSSPSTLSSHPRSRPRSHSAVPPPASHASPSFLSAAHRSSSSTLAGQTLSTAASSIVSPPHSPLQYAPAGSKGNTWLPSYMNSSTAATKVPAPKININTNNSRHVHSHSHHHHTYHHHHYLSSTGSGDDPCLSILAPIATQLLPLQGETLLEQVVQIVAMQLRVKYCFVSQLLTLDELKELEPGEYAALVEQFGGQVPPIDGVMHTLSSWSGDSAHVNPHAFQGYMVDLTIQEQWTAVNRDLALIHPDVAESLMDPTIKSHVGVRLESEHGDIMGVLGIIHDHEMTEDDVAVVRSVLERVGVRVANELDRFRIEANLVYQREIAESTAKNKTKFLADMSHEIRNPMNAVVGVTEILLDTEGLTDEQASLVGVIRTSGQHLLTVINDILDISRIDQDVKFLLEKRPLSLRKCLKDAVSLAGLTPLRDVSRQISVIEWPPEMDDLGPFTELEETNILPLLWSIDHDVPEHLLGDITRLRQVLINLCTNSLKFTQHGRVSVHVSVHRPQQHGVSGSMPTSPLLTGIEPRQQMVFEQRYDVKTESQQSSRHTSSRRRPLDNLLAPKAQARVSNGSHNNASSSSSSPAQHPPKMKVVAPTSNTLDNDSLDENTVILEFAVSDTGVGIPANKITELFTSFSQVDISVSTRFGGTGLGLAISASLVEKMGGHIWVESTEGVGSRFTFTIPFTVCHPSEAEACATTPSSPTLAAFSSEGINHSLDTDRLNDALQKIGGESGSGEGAYAPASSASHSPLPMSPRTRAEDSQPPGSATTPTTSTSPNSFQNTRTYAKVVESNPKPITIDGVPLRILLAEDNPVNQKVALGALRKLGYFKVDVAQNGLEVISKLDLGHVYDLILMDVSMPVMDGIEATKTIVERRLRGLMYRHTEDQSKSFSSPTEHDDKKEDVSTEAVEATESTGDEVGNVAPPSTDEGESREATLYRDYRNSYVVALTASAMGTDKERCMEAGMDDFMTKPFAAPEMKAILTAFVDRRLRGDLEARNEKQLQRALEKKNRCHSPGCLQKKSSDSSINSEKSGLPMLYRSKSPSVKDSSPCQGCDGSGTHRDSEEESGSSIQRSSRLDTPRPLRRVDSTLSSFLNSSRSNSDAGLHGLLPNKAASPTTTPCMLSSLDERVQVRRRSHEQHRSHNMATMSASERASSHSPVSHEGRRGENADHNDDQPKSIETVRDEQQQQQQQQQQEQHHLENQA